MATNEEISKEMDALKKDFASLRGDISDLSHAVKSAGEQKGEAAYQGIRAKGESLRKQGEDAVGKVGHKIEEKPTTSVLTAFGTGLLIGLLLNQRRS